jgi:hypothetical protein
MNNDSFSTRRHDAAATGQRPRLAPRTIGNRVAALACAVVATIMTLGGQLGIVASYSGELDSALSALKAQPPALQMAASKPVPQQAGVNKPAARRQVAVMASFAR